MMMQSALRAGALAALAISTLCAPSLVKAGPSDYVLTPIVEEGEREIDFKAGTAKSRDGERESKYSLGFGWGVNSRWFSEFYVLWHKEAGEKFGFDAWEWENKFQLTETGKYPVDLGFLLEIERPKDRSEGYELRWGPLLQADLSSSLQANLNLLWGKHVRVSEGQGTQLSYQWQLKQRWQPELEYGLQGFGELGAWRHWAPAAEQSHVAGPALFGKVRVGAHQAIKYNAGLLFGLNQASPRTTLRLQAEYEF
ncbi:hypothetical protein [Paucibacter soli]|uniref:hypothetical protein n=1 Tax=Paucibacter soli TaxID=3133433 RepID=UPI003099E320